MGGSDCDISKLRVGVRNRIGRHVTLIGVDCAVLFAAKTRARGGIKMNAAQSVCGICVRRTARRFRLEQEALKVSNGKEQAPRIFIFPSLALSLCCCCRLLPAVRRGLRRFRTHLLLIRSLENGVDGTAAACSLLSQAQCREGENGWPLDPCRWPCEDDV